MKSWLALLLFVSSTLSAQLRLAPVFSSNMILQCNQPIHIWGKATPGSSVSVLLGDQQKATITKADSTWGLVFAKQQASTKPQTILITSGQETVTLENVLIGDVWIASGQSNMEWPMSREMHWKDEKLAASQPLIRLNNPPPAGRGVYGVPYNDSLNRRLTTDSFYRWTGWQVCDSQTVKGMSAIAYYFAKNIVVKEGVPIGIINLSIGGAPIETFISKEATQSSKRFAQKLDGNWLVNPFLPEWVRERGQQNVGMNAAGFGDEMGLNHAYKPAFAYESGIRPLLNFPIKGVLWYQGESNSLEKDRVEEYKDLLHLLIDDYRKGWKQPKMPFYWVQLSSIDTTAYKSQYWPQFRDGQRRLLSEVHHGGMAVSSDVGFRRDVHPTNKKIIGERLARWALYDAYSHVAIVPSGPLPAKAIWRDGKLTISFQYAKGLQAVNGDSVHGFSVDGVNEIATAIESETVTIPVSKKPAFVYYGWKPFSDGNLVNADGLPASTFKLEVK